MNEIKFVDELPLRSVGSGPGADSLLVAFADVLRNNPKQWAKWPRQMRRSSAYARASQITKADPKAPKAFRGGGFEAAVRCGQLYVRFVGGAL